MYPNEKAGNALKSYSQEGTPLGAAIYPDSNYSGASQASAPSGIASALMQTVSLVDSMLERVSALKSAMMQEPPSQAGMKQDSHPGVAGLLSTINDKLRTTHEILECVERYLNS